MAARVERRADRHGALDGHRHHPADRHRPRARRHRHVFRAPSWASCRTRSRSCRIAPSSAICRVITWPDIVTLRRPRSISSTDDGAPSKSGRTFANRQSGRHARHRRLLQDSDAGDVNAAVTAPPIAPSPRGRPRRRRCADDPAEGRALLEARLNAWPICSAAKKARRSRKPKAKSTRAVRILEYFGGEGVAPLGQTDPVRAAARLHVHASASRSASSR